MYSIRKYPPLHAPVCSGAIIKTIDQTQHTSQYFFVLLCALSGNFCILLCNSKFMIENIFFSFFFFLMDENIFFSWMTFCYLVHRWHRCSTIFSIQIYIYTLKVIFIFLVKIIIAIFTSLSNHVQVIIIFFFFCKMINTYWHLGVCCT